MPTVSKVRLFNERTQRFVTGEITHPEGVELLRYFWHGQEKLPRMERVDPRPLTLVYADTGRFASWVID